MGGDAPSSFSKMHRLVNSVVVLLIALVVSGAYGGKSVSYDIDVTAEQRTFIEKETTHLREFITLAKENPEKAAEMIRESPLAQIISNDTFTSNQEFNVNGTSS